MLDLDGSFKRRTEEYLAEHPDAGFDEVERNCFPGEDGKLALFAISPRHLEACATRTCQVLIEGDYSGVLEADRHYLSLSPDFSNLEQVLGEMSRDERRAEITEAAYRDVVASGRFGYEGFVRDVERAAAESGAARRDGRARDEPRDPTRLTRGPPWRTRSPGRGSRSRCATAPPSAASSVAGAARPRGRLPAPPHLRLGRGRHGRERRLEMKTVVSVTPLAVERDSRTYKQAASLARLGPRLDRARGRRRAAGAGARCRSS